MQTNPSPPESNNFLDSRWYAAVDLFCVVIAGALWAVSRGELGWWPLLIAVLLWPARILSGRFPVSKTPFDWLFLLFLITAVIGLWTAYDGSAAWAKFWLIVGAILLFYALAGQPPANIWLVWGAMAVFAASISALFLFSHNWVEQPAKFAAVQQLGQSWMSLRPQLPLAPGFLQSSAVDGVMAMLMPALVAAGIYLIRRRSWLPLILILLAGVLLTVGLLFSSSRSAWLALAGGFLIWLLWAISRWVSRRRVLSRRQAFLSLLFLSILIMTALILLYPDGLAGIARQMPGPNRVNRLALSQDTLNLIRDYAITGAGLGSFPGQYSQYSQITPVFLFDHGHNLYLDMALEQGTAGLLMLLAIFGLSFWLLAGLEYTLPVVSENDLLHGSLLAGLTVILLHGVVDDPLYASSGLLLLFAFSGITAAITRFHPTPINISGYRLSPSVILITAVLILGVLSAATFHFSLRSTWQANIGAIKMAKVELDSNWPTNQWQGDSKAQQLAGAEAKFSKALELNNQNVTALYRLGLIALARQDFDAAVGFLAAAQQLNPGHRGVQKALGYSALWSGDMETAAELVSTLPEAEYELGNYVSWWQAQGKPELGDRASELLDSFQDQ